MNKRHKTSILTLLLHATNTTRKTTTNPATTISLLHRLRFEAQTQFA